jgi:hypothetical protein
MTVGHGAVYDHDGTWDYAHRYAYKLMVGEPKGDVCHHCDNPPCCNWQRHLYDGNDLTNAQDRETRGRRNVQGERHRSARLTETDVRAIRVEPRTHGYGLRLARRYDISPATISAVISGRLWPHVDTDQTNARHSEHGCR